MTMRVERANSALAADFFMPHELSFEQLVLWAKEFASQLPYRNDFNQQSGDWGILFEKSELVVCAAIMSLDEKSLKQQFKQAQYLGAPHTLKFMLVVFQQLEDWYHHLPSVPESSYQLKLLLLNTYQAQLTESLQQLYRATPEDLITQFEACDRLWQLSATKKDDANTTLSEEAQHCLSRILIVIASLKQECERSFNLSLTHGEHPPQLGLYISFLKLFERAQARINQFSHRHLMFYYREVLKQAPQKAKQAPIFLKLSKNKASLGPAIIEKEHKFTPGNAPDFTPIFYRAAYGVTVTDAEVEQLFSFSLVRDPLISPEKELGFASGIVGVKQKLDPNHTGQTVKQQEAIELFANSNHQSIDSENGIQSMGLIISDPIMSLAEGERELTLEFELQELGYGQLYQQFIQLNSIAAHKEGNTKPNIETIKPTLINIFNDIIRGQAPILSDWVSNLSAKTLVANTDITDIESLIAQRPEEQLRIIFRQFYLGLLDIVSRNLLSTPINSDDMRVLFKVLGQLVARHALYRKQWLSKSHIDSISTTVGSLIKQGIVDKTIEATLARLLVSSHTQTFYLLFEEAFNVEVSTDTGWMPVDHAQLLPVDDTSTTSLGFSLNVRLEAGFPSVHPMTQANKNLTSDAPAIKLTLKKQSQCFVYSIFKDFEFVELAIRCHVNGVTQLQLFNQDGQADPSQPFRPLGAQPRDNSYLVIANQEIASKPLTSLSFHFDWADLPQDYDGFNDHYEHYPYELNNHSFQVSTHVLNRGKWEAISSGGYPLFTPTAGRLERESCIQINRMQHSFNQNTQPWPTIPFSPQSPVRNGLFKITLISPSCAFGHHDYAMLLTQTLTHNAKSKNPKPLPKPPYTPILDKLVLHYRAEKRVNLTDISSREECRITQLHPFGESTIYPLASTQKLDTPRLLPQYNEDGHVFLGIRAFELSGYLNLYFLLSEESQLFSPYASNDYQWYYLVNNTWHLLPAKNMIHDTTQGFLNSGVVTLDIPDPINDQNTVMPNGLFWLRVSTNQGLGRYPKCFQVATHVIEAYASENAGSHTSPYAEWQCRPKLSNLDTISQLTPMQRASETENEQEWIIRTSEALRHKGKAEHPWDYERIVLQQFPSIGAVNCFPSHRFDSELKQPGHVLITVIPEPLTCQHAPCEKKSVNSAELLMVRNYLSTVTRPHIQLEVRSPGYEEIQVRCSVSFAEGVHHGLALRRLEYAVTQALCPWQENSLNKGLGWELSLSKLSAFINQQPHIINVSGLSVVKVTPHSTHDYQLEDSARSDAMISAELPWYMLIPAKHHLIEVVPNIHSNEPTKAGIGNLTIGEQFIIQAKRNLSDTEETFDKSTTNKQDK